MILLSFPIHPKNRKTRSEAAIREGSGTTGPKPTLSFLNRFEKANL